MKREEPVVHLEWSKDVLVNVHAVVLPRDGLHDESEDDVAIVGVFEAGTYQSVRCDGAQVAHKLFDRLSSRYAWYNRWESARHVQELAYRDACGGCTIGETKPGKVALHRRIQCHFACFDQLHNCQGSEGFRQ